MAMFLRILRRKIGPIVYRIIFFFFSLMPKDDNLIIFESFLGKQYSDNPRAIYEYLNKNYPGYKLYWSFNKNLAYQLSEIKSINRLSLRWLYYMGRAKYWVSNSRLPLWLRKSKSTIYVQTWHGTPLKKLGVDIRDVKMPGTTTDKYKRNFTKESAKWDYLVSPNRFSTEVFKKAFHFNKEIIESGYPRNDILVQNKRSSNDWKCKLGLPDDKRVILYAPTWRDNQYYDTGKYKLNLQLDLDQLQSQLGEDFIVVLRMHYLVAEKINLEQYKGFAYDFSSYPNISDIYLASDLLITDYSSVFFDYANLQRPILFFVYDIEEYQDEIRGFYLDFEKVAPGPLIKSNRQLIKVIKDIDFDNFHLNKKYKAFINQFCSLENGNATIKVIDTFLEKNKQV